MEAVARTGLSERGERGDAARGRRHQFARSSQPSHPSSSSDDTGAPSSGRRGRAGRPYEPDDVFDPAIDATLPLASRAPPGRPAGRSWAGPAPPPAPRAPPPPQPAGGPASARLGGDALVSTDDDLLDVDAVLGGAAGLDEEEEEEEDFDEDEEEEEDDEDDEDEDGVADLEDGDLEDPFARLETDDVLGSIITASTDDDLELAEDEEGLLLDRAAAAAAGGRQVLGRMPASAAPPPPSGSLLDAAAADLVGLTAVEAARRAVAGRKAAEAEPDLAGFVGGGDGGEDDDASTAPVAYPPPPDRTWGLGSLLAAAGVAPAAVAGRGPDGSSLSLPTLDALTLGGVESDPAVVRPGDLLAWRGPPPVSGPATPPAYPDFYRGKPARTAGEAVVAASARGAAAAVVVAAPGSAEDADPASAAAALSARGGGLPVLIIAASTAEAVLEGAIEAAAAVADAVAVAAAEAAAAAAEEEEGEEGGGALRPLTLPPTLPRATLAGGGPAVAGSPTASVGTALASTFYDHPGTAPSLPTIAFLGGPGKTTAAWLVRGVLEEAGALVALVDSSEYALHADRLDEAGGLWAPSEPDPTAERPCSAAFHLAPYQGKYPAPEPHPDGVRLARVLAGGADRGASAGVVALGSGALASGAGGAISPDVLVYTGAPTEKVTGSPLPLDSPEMASILAAFTALADPDRQRAVVNLDDPAAPAILDAAAPGVPVTYALYNRTADVHCTKARFSLWETEVMIKTPVGSLAISTPLIGRSNITNVLAAVAAGLATRKPVGSGSEGGGEGSGGGHAGGEEDGEEGSASDLLETLDLRTIVRGIEATEVVPGRCECIDEGQPFAVVVDAADTAAALGDLLDGLREAGAKRVITVVGGDGGTPAAGRPFLGEAAHYKSDIVIVSNVNPRGAAPDAIAYDVCAGFPAAILAASASKPYPPGFLQDPGRVDATTLEFLMDAAWEHQRYVCEDRWMAIRWAIGTAGPDDAVALVGKGAQDYIEWAGGGPEGADPVRGWFDDRVEARNALARAPSLWAVTDLDRSELPWVEWEEREERILGGTKR